MARENLVLLHGQVRGLPRIHVNTEGEELKAMFSMRVMRRPLSSREETGEDSLFIDCPVVVTRNKDLIRTIRTLEDGNMVDVRGVISTKQVLKASLCPDCRHKNSKEGNLVYITPIYICRRERATQEEGLGLLKKRREISNVVNVIGTLCRDVHYYKDDMGRDYAQYQLAVNRRFHIKEDAAEIKTDYPWVKTFGKSALMDAQCLHMGSSVYISAALQTREITRTVLCEECGCEYTFTDSATELVPYYTGYLANCDVPVKEGLPNTERIGDESDVRKTEKE